MSASIDVVSMEDLERHVRALTAPQPPTDVLKHLLEAARLATPRAALYLIRKDEVHGWSSVGFPPDAARRLRALSAPLGEGWLGRVAASEWLLFEPDAAGVCPGVGQPLPTECAGQSVRVKDRPIALLVVERHANEGPWHPALVSVLVRVAELQLELDLLRRKIVPGARAAGEGVEAAAPPAALPEQAPAPGLDVARRYARLVATDIRLYNEEAVVLGRSNGDLARRLAEHITRGKDTFLRRHGALGPAALDVLYEAYLEILAAGDDALLPRSILR